MKHYPIATGKAGFDVSAGFASNGYGAHSPGGYSLTAALIAEVVMTMTRPGYPECQGKEKL